MKLLVYDIGGSSVKWATLNTDLEILDRGSIPTFTTTLEENSQRVENDLYKRIIEHINIMNKENEILKVGISSACVINMETGEVVGDNKVFTGYKGLNIYNIIKEGTGLDCVAMNDGNSAVMGEHVSGVLKGVDSAVLLVIGTGIGAGVLNDGKILKGYNYWAGEVGFMWVNGEYWEDIASTINFTKSISKKIGKEVDGRYIFANLDNECIKSEYLKWIDILAIGIKNVFHAYGPETIVLGGGVSAEVNFNVEDILNAIKPMVAQDVFENLKIAKASLGNDANIIGVASLLI